MQPTPVMTGGASKGTGELGGGVAILLCNPNGAGSSIEVATRGG